ncbi:MAG: FimV family protein [Bacteroidota bacterium]
MPALLLAASSAVYALGLGDLRGQPSLGQPLQLEVDILGEGKAVLDPGCFRLIPPSGGADLPWLKKASFNIRQGSPRVLEIRTSTPLREPVLVISLQLACGHEIAREYTLLASPASEAVVEPTVAPPVGRAGQPVAPARRGAVAATDSPLRPVPARLAPRHADRRPASPVLADRVLLSNGVDVGEPSLRLATELLSAVKEANADAQRDILRLEFRMLLAMNEQATSQLATAEKLRNMEATLGELQQRATDFSQRVEKEGVAAPMPPQPATKVALPAAPAHPAAPVPVDEGAGGWEWTFYAALLGALVGLAGWFGWRRFQTRRPALVAGDDDDQVVLPEFTVDPKRESEDEGHPTVDLAVEPEFSGMPMAVDLELDAEELPAPRPPVPMRPAEAIDSVLSVSATTLDEHFEANPVMELADIMLSFGRVKGAAQALQEYIDNNPQEALQPWIRLMDVYRMAGMRSEFEAVSRNLNQNFNVEVQEWDKKTETARLDLVLDEEPVPAPPLAPKPACLEDMPRLVTTVCDLWPAGDVVGYLYQLLRDNRGGQRVGFALPVVEEILFLIELKDTVSRMEKEAITS